MARLPLIVARIIPDTVAIHFVVYRPAAILATGKAANVVLLPALHEERFLRRMRLISTYRAVIHYASSLHPRGVIGRLTNASSAAWRGFTLLFLEARIVARGVAEIHD